MINYMHIYKLVKKCYNIYIGSKYNRIHKYKHLNIVFTVLKIAYQIITNVLLFFIHKLYSGCR